MSREDDHYVTRNARSNIAHIFGETNQKNGWELLETPVKIRT